MPMRPIAPCKGCPNSGTIHTRCEKYNEFVRYNEEYKRGMALQRENETALFTHKKTRNCAVARGYKQRS